MYNVRRCVGSTEDLQSPKHDAAAGESQWAAAAEAGIALVKQWVDKALPYSQQKYCNPEGTSIRGKHYPSSYRTDCSGLVSMAWGLSRSYTTRRLFLGTFPGAEKILQRDKKMSKDKANGITPAGVAVLIAWDDLRPGDMLYKVGHVMLVAEVTPGDTLSQRGTHRIYHQTPKPGAHESIVQREDWEGDMESGYRARYDGRIRRVWCLRNKDWC